MSKFNKRLHPRSPLNGEFIDVGAKFHGSSHQSGERDAIAKVYGKDFAKSETSARNKVYGVGNVKHGPQSIKGNHVAKNKKIAWQDWAELSAGERAKYTKGNII